MPLWMNRLVISLDLKAKSSIWVTVEGRVKFFNPAAWKQALVILVTPAGKTKSFKLPQDSKAVFTTDYYSIFYR